MSNEITVSTNLTINNPSTGGGYRATIQQNGQFTQATLGQCGDIQTVPTTVTDLSISALSTAGWAWFQNLDSTNYIDIGIDQTGTLAGFLRLYPGEFMAVRIKPGINLAAQANTASVKLYWSVWNN